MHSGPGPPPSSRRTGPDPGNEFLRTRLDSGEPLIEMGLLPRFFKEFQTFINSLSLFPILNSADCNGPLLHLQLSRGSEFANSSNCQTRLHGNSSYITSHHITSFLISIGLPPPKCQGGSRALGARVCRAHPPAAQQVPGAQSAGDGAREWRKMLVFFNTIKQKLSHLSRLKCHRTTKIFARYQWPKNQQSPQRLPHHHLTRTPPGRLSRTPPGRLKLRTPPGRLHLFQPMCLPPKRR